MHSVVEPLVDSSDAGGPRAGARLEALFRLHYDPLVRFAAVLTGQPADADDLAQEAFVRLGRAGRGWPEPGRELAYLRTTIVNLSRGRHRRLLLATRRRERPGGPEVDPADAAVALTAHRRTVTALRGLSRRQRECVVLHYYAEMTDREIAEVLGISSGSVKTHLHRARAALARDLEDLR